MLELRSPLIEHLTAGNYGTAPGNDPALVMTEQPLGSLLQIAGWDAFEKQCLALLSKFGFDTLGEYQNVLEANDVECYRIAPDKVLLRHREPNKLADLMSSIDPAELATLDLSHSRCVFTISGIASNTLLSMVVPLDFSVSAFPVGSFAQTGIHHVGVLITREGPDTFKIFVPVTWAASLWSFLCTNAASLRYRVE